MMRNPRPLTEQPRNAKPSASATLKRRLTTTPTGRPPILENAAQTSVLQPVRAFDEGPLALTGWRTEVMYMVAHSPTSKFFSPPPLSPPSTCQNTTRLDHFLRARRPEDGTTVSAIATPATTPLSFAIMHHQLLQATHHLTTHPQHHHTQTPYPHTLKCALWGSGTPQRVECHPPTL